MSLGHRDGQVRMIASIGIHARTLKDPKVTRLPLRGPCHESPGYRVTSARTILFVIRTRASLWCVSFLHSRQSHFLMLLYNRTHQSFSQFNKIYVVRKQFSLKKTWQWKIFRVPWRIQEKTATTKKSRVWLMPSAFGSGRLHNKCTMLSYRRARSKYICTQ